MTGSNVTIGVIARSNINAQDVTDFRNMFHVPVNNPTVILNGPDPGDLGSGEEAEAVLDATWPGAVAPNAIVDLVVSGATNASAGEDLSEFYIIDNNLADVMTESFSVCEAGFGSQLLGANGFAAFYSSMAEQAAAQGITYIVASGDSGPDSCDDPNTIPTTFSAPSVNLLASTPFTVAVGGTELHDCDPLPGCVDKTSTYWGSSGANSGSAKSYIPENVWNESCTVAQCGSSLSGLWSSGGGQSIAFPKPVWQAGVTGIPAANARFVPDVSVAAADHDGYLLCLDGSCGTSNPGGPGFAVLSGTSASAQAFGGIMALVVQKVGARLGIANYALYKLAAGEPPTSPANSTCNGSNTATPPANTCIFNDVTVGDTNIPEVNPGPPAQQETGFNAVVGYDEATGLGSVNVTNLVNQWHTAIVQGSTTTLSLSTSPATNPITLTHGQSVNVSITVAAQTSGADTPSGDVSLVANSSTDSGVDAFTLSNGTVNSSTILLPGSGATPYQVHAHYQGDGTFLGSDSPAVSVTVTPENSQINFGIVVTNGSSCSTPTSVTYGSSYILTVDVADLNTVSTPCVPSETGSSPTGVVHVTDNGASLDGVSGSGNFTLNGLGEFEDPTIQLSAGTHSISASYLGDNSFNKSGPASAVITVGKATTTTSVAASQTAVPSGTPVTLTATVSTQSNATASASQEPTGTIQFLVNGAPSGSAMTVTGGINQNTLFAQATASISPTLANGQSVITAQYIGDNNYTGSSTTSSVTVTVGSSGINVTPGCSSSTISITAPGQSGSCVITVTGANGFSGSIALSAAVSSTPPSAVDVPTCSFGAPGQNFTAPNTIALTASSETGSATMTCSSTAAAQILVRPPNYPSGRAWPLAGVAISLASIFFLFFVPRERRLRLVPLAALLLVVAAAGISCSGSSGIGGGTNSGTTTGAYAFKVTATPSTGSAQSSTVTVNVQ
ncbi:MAG TPA: Ig-like domain repeat protein [Terriglobales bacterium]|nr:Ig-like domain repeat protein [Terriglobales bacterium]